MDQRPKIIISSLDAERLDAMIDAMGNQTFPGMDELLTELDRADIVAPEEMPPNIVTMNSTVKFKEISSGKEFALTLTYPQEKNPNNDPVVSILAPVGSALLGLKEGETIEWPKPGGGVLKVEILEIIYQPERAGEFRR
ncbi:nucleoside diphosphate kinase regulator [Thalassotalea piscium]|uniref:Regulator of nucleoside diphosphate kinase n=1 Tax=Thalassotalea piscium TaxID=1230533 RepID=A0A7X0NHE0_9GAMM|nr:nucleoside diphosphate kinase regulator [Thalassotalea piscium]MBB6543483.1 regulator of nucleoside diphosphate kinase [Thalassotalea piscium]